MDSTTEINKKIFLHGNFEGKYQAKVFSEIGNANFSNIKILEGKLGKVKECNFNSLFNIKSESLYHQDSFNIELKLDDELLKDKYVFIEEFNNTTLYDIQLSNHLKEGNVTFGVIKGQMFCSLEDTFEFDVLNENSYDITKEIDFESTFFEVDEISDDNTNINVFDGIYNSIIKVYKSSKEKIQTFISSNK
jgi:hypothetical protein